MDEEKDGVAEPQTRSEGSLRDRHEICLAVVDDGQGGDITRGGRTLLNLEEWLSC